jgi:hypothetical protein
MTKTGSKTGIFYKTTFYIPTEDKPEMDWSNYCVIGLIAFIVFLGIVGSILTKISTSHSLPVKLVKCFSFTQNFGKIIAVPKQA